MPWSPPAWDSSPVNRVNPSGGRVAHGKHARPAWDEKPASPPDLHREHGVANKKFEAGLRGTHARHHALGLNRNACDRTHATFTLSCHSPSF